MGRIATIELDDDDAAFIEAEINAGNYETEQALLSDALKLLAKRDEAIVSALIEGEESGPSTPFSFAEFLERKMSVS